LIGEVGDGELAAGGDFAFAVTVFAMAHGGVHAYHFPARARDSGEDFTRLARLAASTGMAAWGFVFTRLGPAVRKERREKAELREE
jgi:hypothetical protein